MTDRERDDYADGAALARRDRKTGRPPRYTESAAAVNESRSVFVHGYLTLVDGKDWVQ